MSIRDEHVAPDTRRAIQRGFSWFVRRLGAIGSEPRRSRLLDELTHAVVQTEIVAVAGSPPSAYGVGWDHRPDPLRTIVGREPVVEPGSIPFDGDGGGLRAAPSTHVISHARAACSPRPRAA